MASLLEAVPFDIWHQVASYLGPQDYINSGIAIPQLRGALRDEGTARKVLRSHISFTKEAERAGNGDITAFQAVKRVHDIREAVATAQPFSASVVAYGDSFLFNQGKLCYLNGGQLRVLDVHGSSQEEVVVDLNRAFSVSMATMYPDDDPREPTFALLNYADGNVACVCRVKVPREEHLLVLDVRPVMPPGRRRFRLIRPLIRPRKLFVRQNAKFLCLGTHSGTGRDCHREWLVQTIDLETGQDVTPRPVQLRNFAGSDVGPTVSFEVRDDFFYAISNQTGFRDEEIDWTSYYVCLRFPLSDPTQLQWKRIWRRQHREGPISDTWTDISLHTDESTGRPMIVECRREWLNGASENFRTYYTQPLDWPEDENESNTATSAADADNPPSNSSPLTASMPTHIIPGLPAYMPLHTYPDDPLASLLDSSSKPNYEPPKKRVRRHYHPEYSGAELDSRRDFIHSRTKYTTYNHSASSFVDLVNDPPAQSKFFSTPPDRLRLRIGSRKRKSPIDEQGEEGVPGMLFPPEHLDDNGHPIEHSDERFESRGIHLWPPNDAPRELISLLCPSGRAGTVDACSDDRCIVYSTNPSKTDSTRRPIILLSFDRSICVGTTKHLDLTPKSENTHADRIVADAEDMPVPMIPPISSFVCLQPAMHRSINRGYSLR